MKVKYPGKYSVVVGIIALISLYLIQCNFSPSAVAKSGEEIEELFLNPPLAARPGVLWQWMGGLISKEGITKDLEAMSEQGIGGVIVMQMPDQAPYPQRWDFRDYPGKIKVLSDEWSGAF
ncbi:MAG: glycosyl hydrolase [Bacteroidota bacterium]